MTISFKEFLKQKKEKKDLKYTEEQKYDDMVYEDSLKIYEQSCDNKTWQERDAEELKILFEMMDLTESLIRNKKQ